MTKNEQDPKIIRPIRWNGLREDEAQKVIRERVSDASSVIFGDHAFERVEQRSITANDALRILASGSVIGIPVLCANGVDWKALVQLRMPGGRNAGVVTVIFRPPSKSLFVVTVEWMDK
ncbi:DUF4258 domain-containing protein [Nitrospirillum sp. BR 11164]|uniref:DUF4258 domain-containing protein n=1 Tax=Nitrospirillum sp. BR 11164 TaxID=3104324 RepID=UPI002AFEB3A7|nr:DUF4258 domain-containing protein [Nitrospirillum sp. BR 11164]MEA1649214.1 DUF4258 domain-containing protein [Nitrospirillum sp. BR 11164]